MDFGLGEGATDSEDHALAIVAADAVGDERGAVADNPVDADFVVGGVEGHVRDRGKGAGANIFQPYQKLPTFDVCKMNQQIQRIN